MYIYFCGGKKQLIGKPIKQSVVKETRAGWADGETDSSLHLVSFIMPNGALKNVKINEECLIINK